MASRRGPDQQDRHGQQERARSAGQAWTAGEAWPAGESPVSRTGIASRRGPNQQERSDQQDRPVHKNPPPPPNQTCRQCLQLLSNRCQMLVELIINETTGYTICLCTIYIDHFSSLSAYLPVLILCASLACRLIGLDGDRCSSSPPPPPHPALHSLMKRVAKILQLAFYLAGNYVCGWGGGDIRPQYRYAALPCCPNKQTSSRTMPSMQQGGD
jgi:hypothetical protein